MEDVSFFVSFLAVCMQEVYKYDETCGDGRAKDGQTQDETLNGSAAL